MANVLVLAGGSSPEREVSLRSGAAVAAALSSAGHNVTNADAAEGLEQLLPQMKSVDVVFPALHGEGGEDGVLQKFLEDQEITFVGSGSAASALCYDKDRYTKLLEQNNLPVPKTALVNAEEFAVSELAAQPFALKPNDGGSSIDTFIVRNVSEKNDAAIEQAFSIHGKMLLQELILGTETTVAVVEEESLPVIEIIPPEAQEFDYENKYNGATQELCPPLNVTEELQKQAQALALKIHILTGCQGMSRTDIMINASGKLYVLETNTIPGLTDQSLLPKAAAIAGYDMPTLCSRLVAAALKRSQA